MASSPNLNSNLSIANDLMDAAIKKNAKLVVLPENFALMPHKDNDYLTIAEHLGHGPIQDFLWTFAKNNKIWFRTGHGRLYWRVRHTFDLEPETNQCIKGFSKSDVFYDIGANIGTASVPVCAENNFELIAVEPSKENAALLLKNIFINNIKAKIYCCALVNKVTENYIC